MRVLVTYDVNTTSREGRRRLRRVARACQDYGERVQFSIFECEVTDTVWVTLRRRLLDEYAPAEDSLRFYFLDRTAIERREHHGIRKPRDPDEPLIL